METKPLGEFDPKSVDWIYDNVSDEVQWIWEPFIPRGALLVVAAYMKVGKSTWFYALAGALARGDREFCGFRLNDTNVLVLAAEEHQRDVCRHLKESKAPRGGRLHVHFGLFTKTKDNFTTMFEFCRKHQIGLVFIDPVTRYWSGVVDNENDNTQVTEALAPLHALTRVGDYPLTIALVHHNNKMGEGFKAMRGASALYAMVDQALLMTKHQSLPNARRLNVSGRYSESPPEILVELNDDTGVYARVDEFESEQRALFDKVLSAISDAPATMEQLIAATGIAYRRLRKILSSLEGVKREGTGRKGDPYTYRRSTAADVQGDGEAA